MFDLSEARRRDRSHGLLDAIIGFCKELLAELLISQRFLDQFVSLFVSHLVVRAGIFLDIFYPLVIQLVQLRVVVTVDWPEFRCVIGAQHHDRPHDLGLLLAYILA